MKPITCPLCGTQVPLVVAGTMIKEPNGTLRLKCTNPACTLSKR